MPISQFYTKHGVGQILLHRSFNFNRILLGHQLVYRITSVVCCVAQKIKFTGVSPLRQSQDFRLTVCNRQRMLEMRRE
jgi:hypothetical protein